jgi:hypothetical protein
MTDRELLEAAARAAGIDLQTKTIFGRGAEPGFYLIADGAAPIWFWWNPLTDDGDALRLAGRLEMDIMHRCNDPEVWVQVSMMPPVIEPIGEDRYAATRRAIVRAAAQTVLTPRRSWLRRNG